MSPYKTYRYYIGMKNHLLGNVDAIKYNGIVRTYYETFEARNDKVLFERLAIHHDVKMFITANLVDDVNRTVHNFNEDSYNRMKRSLANLTYNFKRYISAIPDIHSHIEFKNGNSPLLRDYFSGKVDVEIVCILNAIFNVVDYWKTKTNSFVYEETFQVIPQYQKILEFDKDAYKEILINKYRSN